MHLASAMILIVFHWLVIAYEALADGWRFPTFPLDPIHIFWRGPKSESELRDMNDDNMTITIRSR